MHITANHVPRYTATVFNATLQSAQNASQHLPFQPLKLAHHVLVLLETAPIVPTALLVLNVLLGLPLPIFTNVHNVRLLYLIVFYVPTIELVLHAFLGSQ